MGSVALLAEVRVERLVHVYPQGSVRALDEIDLWVAPGESVALIGQNGSGKTTLVRHLNGLLRPTEGRVTIGGVDAAALTVAALARCVGLLFQDPDRQIFARDVRAEVAFGPRNLGLGGDELEAAVSGALESVGLSDVAGRNPYDLGASRRKLVALASVLAMGTPIVVLDEPTTGQDARGVERIGTIVEGLAAAGRTVIAVSHDMRFVAGHFSRVVVMRAGRVVLDGTPGEIFAEPRWPDLAASHLEPPYAARVGARLRLGSTPDDTAVIAALTVRSTRRDGR